MSQNNPRSIRRLAARTITVAAITGVAVTGGFAGVASASTPAAATAGETPVLVGPMLDFFAFGANIGAPLVCATAAAGVGDGAAQYGFAAQASTLVNAINTFCSTASSDGAKLVTTGQATDSPLAALNALVNPLLQSSGESVTEFGNTYGSAMSPFGPTVTGLGGTIEWFEGS